MMELKKCPFCGSEARYTSTNKYHVVCTNNACPAVEVPEVWNHRPIEDDLQRQLIEKDRDIERLKELLDESFKLQTHSAKLLNMHDGGERIVFDSIEQFEERLKFVKENYRKAAKDVAKKESEGE